MRPRSMMKDFQNRCVTWLNDGHRGACLADMGSGKTIITLTHRLDVSTPATLPVLVISTLRVVELVWEDEALAWEHTQHLKFAYVTGTPAQRHSALHEKADIFLINIENIMWLMSNYPKAAFSCVVLDELSLWKGMGKRWKAVRQWLAESVEDVIGLTGSPATNGYEGLWPQMELVEKGMLGRTMTLYRQTHFWQVRDHMIELRPGEANKIRARMAPHVFRISNAELDMPELKENDIPVRIPEVAARKLIGTFRRESYIREHDDDDHPGWEISGNSAASAINKMVQMGNGACYTDEGEVLQIHTGKIDALKDYVNEQQGSPVMIAFHYRHDIAAIRKALPGIRCMDGDLSRDEARMLKDDWNKGRLPYMAIHPGSGGHGLNLQESACSRVLWYSMTYDLDAYDQLNARVCRQGNDTPTVFVDRLIAGPEDRVIAHSLTNKTSVQDALLQYYEDLA